MLAPRFQASFTNIPSSEIYQTPAQQQAATLRVAAGGGTGVDVLMAQGVLPTMTPRPDITLVVNNETHTHLTVALPPNAAPEAPSTTPGPTAPTPTPPVIAPPPRTPAPPRRRRHRPHPPCDDTCQLSLRAQRLMVSLALAALWRSVLRGGGV